MKIFLVFLATISASLVNGSESIGYYSSGSLKNAESILDRGTKIHKLFLARKRFYGSLSIQDTISDAVDFINQKYPNAELLQVGDISNKAGGACKEHSSHQNGLDADIVYLTKNGQLQSQNAAYWEEDFVKNGIVSGNFHLERNLELFKYLVMNHPISRIFVDEAIKKELCTYAKKNNLFNDNETLETLRRLRIEKLHSTHFHMRLKCPASDLNCTTQAEVPAGPGC